MKVRIRSEDGCISQHSKIVDLLHLFDSFYATKKEKSHWNLEKALQTSGNTAVSRGQQTTDNNVLPPSWEGQRSPFVHDNDYAVDAFVALRESDPNNPVTFKICQIISTQKYKAGKTVKPTVSGMNHALTAMYTADSTELSGSGDKMGLPARTLWMFALC